MLLPGAFCLENYLAKWVNNQDATGSAYVNLAILLACRTGAAVGQHDSVSFPNFATILLSHALFTTDLTSSSHFMH